MTQDKTPCSIKQGGIIRRLEVENFPVVVIIDSEGNNLYETGRQNFLAAEEK